MKIKEATINRILTGPAEGEGLGGLQPPHFFGNFKELLRKRCFQPPHFESLFSPPPPPPTFKVAPRALSNVLITERLFQNRYCIGLQLLQSPLISCSSSSCSCCWTFFTKYKSWGSFSATCSGSHWPSWKALSHSSQRKWMSTCWIDIKSVEAHMERTVRQMHITIKSIMKIF